MAEDERNDDAPETLPSPMAPGAPLAARRDSDTSCLSEDEVLAYVEGRTTSRLRDQVDRHLDDCQDCWLLVEALLGDVRVPSAELPAPFRITTFSVGDLIADRYRIEQFVGKGGMGEVYRAHDTLMQKVVALKTPLCTSCDDPSALRKFFDEARNADRITHENICRIYALQEHREPSGDRPTVPFFTMEFIEGMSLAARIKQGPLPLPTVRSIARQLLRGLRAAHHQRVLHLDFKSDNVMLRHVRRDEVQRDDAHRIEAQRDDAPPTEAQRTEAQRDDAPPDDAKAGKSQPRDAGSSGRGEPRVEAVIMDFGLSRQRDAVLRASQYLRGIGTLQYMALEQLEGQKNLTPAVDVYAFGVVLFEMLTGRLPFLENSLGAMLKCQQRERPPAVSELRPGVHPALDAYVARCLHRSAQRRFPDAVAALAAFDALPSWTTSPLRQRARTVAVVAAGTLGAVATVVALSGALRAPSSADAGDDGTEIGVGQLQTSATSSSRERKPAGSTPTPARGGEAHAGEAHGGEAHGGEASIDDAQAGEAHGSAAHGGETQANEARTEAARAEGARAGQTPTGEARASPAQAGKARGESTRQTPDAAPEPRAKSPPRERTVARRPKKPGPSSIFTTPWNGPDLTTSKEADARRTRALNHVPKPLPMKLADPAAQPRGAAAASVTVARAPEPAAPGTPPTAPATSE